MKKLFIKLSLLLILSALCLVFANSIYKKYFYWADIDRFDANILLQLDSLQYVSDVLYFAESSNACYAQSDTNKSSTSNILDSLSPFKVNAVELRTALWSCSTMHDIEQKYVDVIRDEIENFRKIFINWIGVFDKTNDLPDEWHLFNDPASFPEDDEPFDPNDFFNNQDDDE